MKITREILSRVESGRFAFSDPCVIDGQPFGPCGHGMEETAAVIRRVKKLTKQQRQQIMRGEELNDNA